MEDLQNRVTRRLCCIDYPRWKEVDLETPADIHAVVCWLEEHRLRALSTEQRGEKLAQYESRAQLETMMRWYWHEVVGETAERVPHPPETLTQLLDALIEEAIATEYTELEAEYVTSSSLLMHQTAFDGALLQPDERQRFHQAVVALAQRLGFDNNHLNSFSTLEILQSLRSVCHRAFDLPVRSTTGSYAQTLDEIPLGFSTGDRQLDEAAKILRLLFITDLKDIQAEINSLLEKLQSFTALPATDSSLGRHGR
jgi:RLL motif-containing protein 1